MKTEITFEKLPDGTCVITVKGKNMHGDTYIKQAIIESSAVFDALQERIVANNQLIDEHAQQQQPQWNDVNKCLPPEGKDVLAYVAKQKKTIVAYYYKCCWSDTIPKIGNPFWKVTHWMELPINPGL